MRGGVRPNSGRKRGGKNEATIKKEQMKERLKELVAKEWDGLIEAQIDKARGIKLQALGREGEVIYKDPGPDTFAFKTLAEHSVGKPKEEIELSGDENNPIELNVNFDKTIKKVYGDNSNDRPS